MVAVICAAFVGQLCATSPGERSSSAPPSLSQLTTFATRDYRLEFNRSDVHTPYDLKDFRAACRQKDCLRIKAHADGCAVGIEFGDAAEPKGMTNLFYAVRAQSLDGLKRGLAETFVRRRAGDDASFAPLSRLIPANIGNLVCP